MQPRNRFLTRSALFAALICILAPLAVPVGPVPVTLGVFAVMFAGVVLDWKQACSAVGVYLLLGLIGLPVFAAGKSGPGVLFGSTGGYIWTYLPMAVLTAAISAGEKLRPEREVFRAFCACLLSLLICYACGTLQFMLVTGVNLSGALAGCVYPFVIFDLIKCAAAAVLGIRIRRRLREI